jgi:hypothetical protein
LDELNREVLAHAGVQLASDALPVLNVSVARLALSGTEIREFQRSDLENPIDVYRLNLNFLSFARLTARDVLAGDLEGLIVLGADIDQIRALSNLSNRAIREIARCHQGLVYTLPPSIQKATTMHPKAQQYFSMSLISNGCTICVDHPDFKRCISFLSRLKRTIRHGPDVSMSWQMRW